MKLNKFLNCLSFDGRIGRKEFRISFIVSVFIYIVLHIVWLKLLYLTYGESTNPDPNHIFFNCDNLILNPLEVLLLWFFIAQGVKRCHDLNKSGAYLLLNIFILPTLAFSDGMPERNKYGESTETCAANSEQEPDRNVFVSIFLCYMTLITSKCLSGLLWTNLALGFGQHTIEDIIGLVGFVGCALLYLNKKAGFYLAVTAAVILAVRFWLNGDLYLLATVKILGMLLLYPVLKLKGKEISAWELLKIKPGNADVKDLTGFFVMFAIVYIVLRYLHAI